MYFPKLICEYCKCLEKVQFCMGLTEWVTYENCKVRLLYLQHLMGLLKFSVTQMGLTANVLKRQSRELQAQTYIVMRKVTQNNNH